MARLRRRFSPDTSSLLPSRKTEQHGLWLMSDSMIIRVHCSSQLSAQKHLSCTTRCADVFLRWLQDLVRLVGIPAHAAQTEVNSDVQSCGCCCLVAGLLAALCCHGDAEDVYPAPASGLEGRELISLLFSTAQNTCFWGFFWSPSVRITIKISSLNMNHILPPTHFPFIPLFLKICHIKVDILGICFRINATEHI